MRWTSYTSASVSVNLGFISVAESATVNTVINASVMGNYRILFGGYSKYYEAKTG